MKWFKTWLNEEKPVAPTGMEWTDTPSYIDHWELDKRKFEKIIEILKKKKEIGLRTTVYLHPKDYYIFKTQAGYVGMEVPEHRNLLVGGFNGGKTVSLAPLLGMLRDHYAVYENGELVAGGDFDEKLD